MKTISACTKSTEGSKQYLSRDIYPFKVLSGLCRNTFRQRCAESTPVPPLSHVLILPPSHPFLLQPAAVEAQFLIPDWGDKLDYGIRLSYWPYRLPFVGWHAGTTTLCHSRLYPVRQGLRIRLLITDMTLYG